MAAKQVFIIEDNPIMQECIARAATQSVRQLSDAAPRSVRLTNFSAAEKSIQIHHFSNVITAIQALNQVMPDLIFLDILLNGPDGFSFLNELISYEDTNKIPIVIITSLNLPQKQLKHYNVIQVLQKETMLPADIANLTARILENAK